MTTGGSPGMQDASAADAPPLPVRVVHFVSPALSGDEGVLACRDVLARGELSSRVCVVGTHHDAARVRRLGVSVDAVIPIPAHPRLSGQASRAEVSRLARHAPGPWAACSWGVRLAHLGRTACGVGAAGRVVVETRGPRDPELIRRVDGSTRGGAMTGGLGGATFVGAGVSVARAWDRAGACDVRSAPICFAPVDRSAPGGRQQPGNDGRVAGDRQCVGLLADPASLGDARQFVFVLGLLYAAGLKVDGLVPAGAWNSRRAARFVRDHGRRWGLREWTGPVHELAARCDALLCPATGEGSEELAAGPAVLAAAGGCEPGGPTLIVHDSERTRELQNSGYTVELARDSRSVTLASRLLDCLTRRPRAEGEQSAIDRRADGGTGAADAGSFGRIVAEVIIESAGLGRRVAGIDTVLAAG